MASDGQSSKHQELLSGLPDHIVLTHIVKKLPWGTFRVLCSVSRNWRQVIQEREVDKARVHSHSRETLVAIKHLDPRDQSPLGYAISLYSMRENAFYRLPPMSSTDGGISCLCKHLSSSSASGSAFSSLDGKLYVKNSDGEMGTRVAPGQELKRVCMLDVAGQKQWKHCASVENPGREYAINIGCGLLAGRSSYVQGGDEDWFDLSWRKYDSTLGKWEKVKQPFEIVVAHLFGALWGMPFLVNGKKYRIRQGRVFVYDSDSQSWVYQHSLSCHELGAGLGLIDCKDSVRVHPLFVLPVNGELVAKARWTTHDCEGICLLQTRGFGTESREIVWQKIHHPFQIDDSCDIFPIKL